MCACRNVSSCETTLWLRNISETFCQLFHFEPWLHVSPAVDFKRCQVMCGQRSPSGWFAPTPHISSTSVPISELQCVWLVWLYVKTACRFHCVSVLYFKYRQQIHIKYTVVWWDDNTGPYTKWNNYNMNCIKKDKTDRMPSTFRIKHTRYADTYFFFRSNFGPISCGHIFSKRNWLSQYIF